MIGSLKHCKYAIGLALLAAPMNAQSADATAKQRNAAAAMQESLAKQRASIEQQTGNAAAVFSFCLARPASGALPAPWRRLLPSPRSGCLNLPSAILCQHRKSSR
jgi:hypothetical protein